MPRFPSAANVLRTALMGVALACALLASPVFAQADADPILIQNASVAVRKSDYLLELERLPAEARGGFANSPRRVLDLLQRMLVERTVATQARNENLLDKRNYKARLAVETDRVLTAMKLQEVELAAAEEFEALRASFEKHSREIYLTDRAKYQLPETVTITHILFDAKKRDEDEARKAAQDARAQLAAGKDFAAMARANSDDPSAPRNNGRLENLRRADLDPAFAAAAFALQPGELSLPVKSQFGWHVIRLEAKTPARTQPFDDVKDAILAEQRAKYVGAKREQYLASVRNDGSIRLNEAAVDELVVRVDRDEVRRKVQDIAPGAMAPPK
jgi:peptidyl-prolyl cis-trans isomerase C